MAGRRHELSDEAWARVEAALPAAAATGRPRRDPRIIVNGMVWILMTGAPWRDLPERFGPWQTVYHRFNQWSKDGTIEKIAAAIRAELDQDGLVDWSLWCIDGTIVRASRSAAGAQKNSSNGSRPTTR